MPDDGSTFYTWDSYAQVTTPLEMPEDTLPALSAILSEHGDKFIVRAYPPDAEHSRHFALVYWFGGLPMGNDLRWDWNAYMEDGPGWVCAHWNEGDTSLGDPDYQAPDALPRDFMGFAAQMETDERNAMELRLSYFPEPPFTARARTSLESWAVDLRAANA